VTTLRAKKDLDSLNGRFIEAMEALGHTGYSLSKDLGTSEAVISNIRNRRNPPNIQLVRDMLNKYLELDPEWLLFGRGSMKREGDRATPSMPPNGTDQVLRSVDSRMASLEELIKRSLHNQLERAVVEDESLADLDERIAALEKQLSNLTKAPGRR
jgi:hypothetical protein